MEKNKEIASYFILGKGEVMLGETSQENSTEIVQLMFLAKILTSENKILTYEMMHHFYACSA